MSNWKLHDLRCVIVKSNGNIKFFRVSFHLLPTPNILMRSNSASDVYDSKGEKKITKRKPCVTVFYVIMRNSLEIKFRWISLHFYLLVKLTWSMCSWTGSKTSSCPTSSGKWNFSDKSGITVAFSLSFGLVSISWSTLQQLTLYRPNFFLL